MTGVEHTGVVAAARAGDPTTSMEAATTTSAVSTAVAK